MFFKWTIYDSQTQSSGSRLPEFLFFFFWGGGGNAKMLLLVFEHGKLLFQKAVLSSVVITLLT